MAVDNFKDEEEEVLVRKKNRYNTPVINRSKVSRYELDEYFLGEESSVVVFEEDDY